MGRPVGPRFRQMVRKNSGLVSFAPESRLPFVQIKSVRFTGKRPRRAETGIKLMAWKKWNAKFRLEYSFRKKQDYLYRCFVAPGNFLLERPKKGMFHLLSNRIFQERLLTVNMQPLHISAPVPTQAEGSILRFCFTWHTFIKQRFN